MKKNAFVLMPFAEELSDVYEHLIKGSLMDAGYDVARADDIRSQNNILCDIVQGIANSDLIVSDLTGSNPNVYYELGIAHALNKKVILITQNIDELPFDLRSYRVIGYSTHFSRMNDARNELKELASQALDENLPFGNPVSDFASVADVKQLQNEERPSVDDQNDLGLFDYRVMLEEGFGEMTVILTRVSSKLELELTPEINKAGEKIVQKGLSTKQQRNIIRELAKHLQSYGAFLKPDNESYRKCLSSVESALENILSRNFEVDKDEKEDLLDFMGTLKGLESSAYEGRQGIQQLVEAMEAQPKIERDFNRARVFVVSELKTFINNIDQTAAIISRAQLLGNSLIDKSI